MSQSKNHKRLSEVNLKKVEAIETYIIDGKMYVCKKFLEKFYNISYMSINKWEKQGGMKRSTKGLPKLILYDFDYVQKFREDMVVNGSRKNSNDNKGYKKKDIEDETEYAKVELAKKKNEVTLQEFKIKEAKGDLVPSDTTDKAIAEFGAYFVGFLRNSRITLSRDLLNMSQDEMFAFLDLHYGEFVNEVSKRVNVTQEEKVLLIYDELYKRISE